MLRRIYLAPAAVLYVALVLFARHPEAHRWLGVAALAVFSLAVLLALR